MVRVIGFTSLVICAALLSGCGGSGKQPAVTATDAPDTGAVATASAAPVETKSVTVKVDGMTCKGCAQGVAMSLKETDGIVDAKVDFDAGEATVTVDAAKHNTQQVIEIIKKAGWDASEKAEETTEN